VARRTLRREENFALGNASFAAWEILPVRGTDVDVPGGDVALRNGLAEARLTGLAIRDP
jgi:hypothetical protein